MFFTGPNETFPSGNKLVHGQQGEVTGPATLEGFIGMGVRVFFPGNKASINCYLTTVRRLRAAVAASPPPAAPHTRCCPCPVRTRDSLCRGATALTACAAARAAAHCPVAGGMVAASVAAPGRAAAAPSLLTPLRL